MKLRPLLQLFAPVAPLADPVRNVDCAFWEVNNWAISEFVVKRLVPLVGWHPFPLNEQMLMTAAVCRIKPAVIFEWGTNVGASARIFHEIGRAFALEMQIHSIDLPDDAEHGEHPGRQRGRLLRGISAVRLHQGDGLDVALKILGNLPQKDSVLFFLDGDHAYDSVYRELKTIVTTVPSASVLVHDTFCQSAGSGYNTGPYHAVQDVLAETDGNFDVFSQNLGLPGMTLLWKRGGSERT